MIKTAASFLFIVALALQSFVSQAQGKFTMSGKFDQPRVRIIKLSYNDPDSGNRQFSIPIKDGKFQFTHDITSPQVATIDIDSLFWRTLLIAPGYTLNMHVDKDQKINYSGHGRKANQLAQGFDSIANINRYKWVKSNSDFLEALVNDRDSTTRSFNSLVSKIKTQPTDILKRLAGY